MNTFKLLYASSALAVMLASCASNDEPGNNPSNPGRIKVTVVDYSPMPGQFVNDIPEYTAGDNIETIKQKAQKALNQGDMISLGAFGGSVTLKLATPITRSVDGSADFRVLGNAFLSTAETAADPYGSSEPGIVMVMTDVNKNGLPDDTWYILAGEHFDKAVSTTVTYTDNSSAGDDTKYVYWEDNHGNSGYLPRIVAYHNHPFFPQWAKTDKLTVTALRLPDNGFFDGTSGYFYQRAYTGYADSWPNTSAKSALSLANAYTLDGKPANVDRVDFVKIQTAVLQVNGALGEASTEVAGIESLH